MVNKKIIKDWLKRAQEDFDFASAKLEFKKIHDLTELLRSKYSVNPVFCG